VVFSLHNSRWARFSENKIAEKMKAYIGVASNSDLIWRGTGTRRVSQHSDPEKRTKNINETVDKILAQFPPKLKR
jgi:hypothetical protein